MTIAALAAWWFIGISFATGAPRLYGPFDKRAQCEAVREWRRAIARPVSAPGSRGWSTPCWWTEDFDDARVTK